uniref:NACHT-NTPase and P-loop NTPases N-terminal domain-containing protein n=1 Tax=Mycena chlorophos TaxID=658473 RepID=A0ABQ0LHV4_MYCCL|nr:predicted protein [Mycena chlorophos]
MPSCFSPFLRKLHLKRKVKPRKPTTTAQPQPVDVAEKAPLVRPETLSTAKHAFVLALRTLGSISGNIPFGSVLNSVIDPLLDIMDRVEETAENQQGFLQLASRVHMLEPIIQQKKANEPACKEIVEALGNELKSIHEDIEQALHQGTIASFFNSQDNASGIVRHNVNLTQLIGDSTQQSINEVLKTLKEIQAGLKVTIKDNQGGLGGAGGNAFMGGAGGAGEGPAVEIDADNVRWISEISGGRGGPGGDGDMRSGTGGTGGVGKAPDVKFLLRELRG